MGPSWACSAGNVASARPVAFTLAADDSIPVSMRESYLSLGKCQQRPVSSLRADEAYPEWQTSDRCQRQT
jgi:hypothetical protein